VDARELKGRRKNLAKFALARADIEAALRLCDYVASTGLRENEPLYWACHDSVVVSYARPFKTNKPLGALGARGAASQMRAYKKHTNAHSISATSWSHTRIGTTGRCSCTGRAR
jgi:hypothetical protein